VSASAASSEPQRSDDRRAAGATVAWCDHCERVVAEDEMTVTSDGTRHCPDCSEELVPTSDDDAPPKAPWHFKVLLLGTIGYLIYRLIWFIFWISHHA
jgi:hypothetical protein